MPDCCQCVCWAGLHLDRARGAGYRFLFVPIALDQGFEHLTILMCPDVLEPVRQGNDFVVCTIADYH